MGATKQQKNHVLTQSSRKAFIKACAEHGHVLQHADGRNFSTLECRRWVYAHEGQMAQIDWAVPASALKRDIARNETLRYRDAADVAVHAEFVAEAARQLFAVLRGFDEDVRAHVTKEMQRRGLKIITGRTIKSIEAKGECKRVELSDRNELEVDQVLFAIGRLPGWIAQWKEMHDTLPFRIGRPRQVYTRETLRSYVPIDAR